MLLDGAACLLVGEPLLLANGVLTQFCQQTGGVAVVVEFPHQVMEPGRGEGADDPVSGVDPALVSPRKTFDVRCDRRVP